MDLSGWIGRTESRSDTVTAAPIAALSATLDRDDPAPRRGEALPLLWHWLYFLPRHRESELDVDGHARRGEFLPPVPLARRMYAGGRVEVHHSICVGDEIERVSRIADVSQKEGRSGPLVFVKLRHEISNRDGLALVEDHDIVYRDHPKVAEDRARPPTISGREDAEVRRPDLIRSGDFPGAEPAKARPTEDEVATDAQVGDGLQIVPDAEWHREIRPDEVLLFRYSALTFNGYRIHYDRRFAVNAQGYPGLVVHAPLVATLLADLLRRQRPQADVSAFSFRAVRPLFDGHPFFVCGNPPDDRRAVTLWARDANGAVAFEATALLRSGFRRTDGSVLSPPIPNP
jgi:3-methylfumaryl-CoA hydratase